MSKHYDIIIIGTGAGGGTLAIALAPTGKRILLLDRGDYIPREKDNWHPREVYINKRYRTDERWLNSQEDKFQPSLYHRVGGSTKVYGAALLRMRPRDFEQVSHYGGVSPAWEVKYDEFAPYYKQAEKLYLVHENNSAYPTESFIESKSPFPPIPHEPYIQTLAKQLDRVGLQPFSLPMGINRDLNNLQTSPCVRCDTCDGYPCLINAKADAQVCGVDRALEYENVELITGAEVNYLITDTKGYEVNAVAATINGQKVIFRSDFVVVACGAVNSAALLLRSANNKHPQGLANSSGMVGRNLMKHNVTKLYAIASQKNPTVFQKTLAINDFYFGSPDSPYPLGHIHLMGKHKWEMMQPDFPGWVPKSILKYLAEHSVDWWLQSEDLPDLNNRIQVDSHGQIKVNYHRNNLQGHRILRQKFVKILRQIGYPITFSFNAPLSNMNHQVGTCRFGSDAKTNVLDLNCRTHDIDNLYVVDSSFFPSISAVNPTLTIVANALRVADHLQARFKIDCVKRNQYLSVKG